MENVKIADEKVTRLRHIIAGAGEKTKIVLLIDELVGYLQAMERLAALERTLSNITSDTFYKQG